MRPPEKFAAGVWASLQSGYALLARRPDTSILQTNPAELPLIESETVFRQTRPPHSSSLGRLGEAAVRDWIDGLVKHPLAWAIEHSGKWIGEIRLDALDGHDRRAKLAIGLYDPELLGRGLGRQAIMLLLAHAFTVMTLHRVSLRVLAYNGRAIRCYAACGFVEEGREREAAFVDGEWHDDVMMGLLAHEFSTIRG